MKISVVIPAYNEELYLPKTLASILAQNRKPDEIIVIDASSGDRTATHAMLYGARVIPDRKKTIGYSRQLGVKEAMGDVVAFTDADSVVPPDWLTHIEKELSQPNVVGFFGGFRVPDGPWWYRWYVNQFQPLLNSLAYTFFRLPMACGQNMAFWKDKALTVGGFPEDFKIAEDIEMARRLMGIGKVVFDQQFAVTSSGRRGNEGIGLFTRIPRAFLYYFLFRKADRIGFPDIR